MLTYSQIFENKLRWKWTYTYSDNQRIGIFQTYYKEDNYSQKEIRIFNENDQLVEKESMYLSKFNSKSKVKLFYRKNGLLKRIEEYECYDENDSYQLRAFIDVKVKSKVKINREFAEKINQLYLWNM